MSWTDAVCQLSICDHVRTADTLQLLALVLVHITEI